MDEKLIVDLFAGGGGMSVAFERAFGRSPDIAINHNDDALSMHRMNHPQTRHFIADVYEVCPIGATQGRPVGWLHLSPDCTHHSQASGGQPRSKKIRGLSWVGYRWAGQVMPDVISLENVRQILKWGPLVAKRDKATGRVVKLDGSVAARGEHVPVQLQYLVPDPKREGQTWSKFVSALENLGYVVEWRRLIASSLGGHTTRERLFMIARRDGRPIAWPEETHFKSPKKGQQRCKPAADCIDFSDLGKSIFDRLKPLAPATMRRIAKGVQRYILDSAKPFIVPIAHYNGSDTAHPIDEPLRTVTAATKGGEFSLASPVLVQAAHGEGKPGRAQRWGDGCRDIQEPLGTVTASGGYAVATAYMMQANDGFNTTVGRDLSDPMTTITNSGSQQQLVTAHLTTLRRNCVGVAADEPLPTITAGAEHHGLVECVLSPEQEAGALRVAAFLMEYYSEGGQWSELDKPLNTITTRDRLALVTVFVKGTPYVIVDIRLRMLKPRELFNGQDFPPDYIIERGHDGRKFSISAQVRMCGNSVNPVMAEGFLRANAPWLAVRRAAA
ncbi:MAG: DNA cytosine methyltransferase [Rhodocyclaceae bacterium]|nr:MAG: DNA cytosine methyltransferase [Rhodocyclaceae bacterium]